MIETISVFILGIGSLGTLVGALFVYKTLKAGHDWNRRKYAADFLQNWDLRSANYTRAIQEKFPHIRDIDRTTGKGNEITKEMAKKIYTCEPVDKENWELRFHIIEFLNFLEDVALAYNHNVADREMLLVSIKDTTIRWSDALRNFMEIVEECDGTQPWRTFIDLINEWKSTKVRYRKPTA